VVVVDEVAFLTAYQPDRKMRERIMNALACPSYGRVDEEGAPDDPGSYDYDRDARDALSFATLFDRFIQNLRRYWRRIMISASLDAWPRPGRSSQPKTRVMIG
jgi:hypothetical protein